MLRKRIIQKELIRPVSFEELSILTGGYGILRHTIEAKSASAGKTLAESSFREKDINIMAIIRDDKTIANPAADEKFLVGDELISFGKIEQMRKELK